MAWSAGAVLTAAQLNTYVPQTWTGYTPTLTGTGTTQGNASMTGGYLRRGPDYDFYARAALGSTSVIGSVIQISLPATPFAAFTHSGLTARFSDASAGSFAAIPFISGSVVQVYVFGASGAFAAPSSTSPFTWASGDAIEVHGTFRVT